jgi:uncharacterized LabA/DUF88 family protein
MAGSAAAAALATDPLARVMVFIDGQNLYKRCRELFGHPLCHPHLLAQYLAGTRTRHPVVCRYYTGRPNPHIRGEAEKTRNLDRRLYAMRQVGVTVVHRPLRYHWEWGHRQTLPRPAPGLPGRTVTLYPWQRPQEKGIDLVMALDLIESVLLGRCDVPIVVSLDRDLHEIPLALRKLQPLIGRPVRLEAAVPVPPGLRYPKTLSGFQHTHQITSEVFDWVRDDTDYTIPDALWKPPSLPPALPPRTPGP